MRKSFTLKEIFGFNWSDSHILQDTSQTKPASVWASHVFESQSWIFEATFTSALREFHKNFHNEKIWLLLQKIIFNLFLKVVFCFPLNYLTFAPKTSHDSNECSWEHYLVCRLYFSAIHLCFCPAHCIFTFECLCFCILFGKKLKAIPLAGVSIDGTQVSQYI